MKIIALILTLSQGVIEIRSEGTFDTPQQCIEHFIRRSHNHDFRKGDVAGARVNREDLEAVVRTLFGGRA